ncbi:MAG: hypothetical protein Q4D35_04135 [Ruminococcus sp.]|nr:hypothetical protein [Ruminococcus sp.]
MENKLYKVHMGKAKCALDLGDGSERAEYVNQDYILHTLGRPHRNIGIMYTYYPKDEQWPARISEACKDMNITFQWDYPYDDYFPYKGGIGGTTDGEPFTFMKDIRKHGQDVTLTLTIDCSLDDEYLRQIAREIKPYGRMKIRINHECHGDWFTHNQRYSYEEIGKFFVKFANIIKEEAPNVETIFCAGFSRGEGEPVDHEEEFKEAYRTADVWSSDAYLSLHFGWPYDVAEKGNGGRYYCLTVDEFYNNFKNTAERLKELNGGVAKPLVTAEFNNDGDVTGPLHQGEAIKRFTEKIKSTNADWFNAISMYQFRDRGRLGLEIEDPNNNTVGIPQPLMKDYKEILNDEYFMPAMDVSEELTLPAKMRWGSAEDSDGIAIKVKLEKSPEFFEITFEEELSLMIEINGRWFYKAPETKTIDLMSAFFENPVADNSELTMKIFATPADGVNDQTENDDWNYNYYAEMTKMPDMRIRYEPVGIVK